MLFPGGYSQILTPIAQGIDIRTRCAVTDVHYDDSAQTVHVTSSEGIVTARAAIVTIPLGVLKSSGVTFTPELPARKRLAIDGIGFGLLDKCYLRFERTFWSDTDWITTLTPMSLPGQWNQWVNLERATGMPILLGFNAATYAHTVAAQSNDDIIAGALARLRTMYPEAPDPIDAQITRWSEDEFSRGSYSYWAVGTTEDMRSDLAQPEGDVLFFAGEATHERFPSTVHGAYESGLRAADQALDVL